MALKNKKEEKFSEWFTEINEETGAKLVDTRYGGQGLLVHMPTSLKIIRKIEKYFEQEVEQDGYDPILLPVLVPEKYISKEKEHIKGFAPELLWVTEGGKHKLEERFFLRPTGESQIYPMYSQWIRTHKDLPLKRYQSRIMAYRFESTTRPWFRGREFIFFETHGVFRDHKGVMNQIRKDMRTTRKVIFDKLAIPFLYFKRPSWDAFPGAMDTFAADVVMPNGRVNQIASTHDLSQNFAKGFNIKFADEKNKEHYTEQTCYGPGIWRIMASLIGLHGDNHGLVMPFDLAPTQVVIVPIFRTESKKRVMKFANTVKDKLKSFRVKLDDSDKSPGFKFNQWEMVGTPIRIEVGPEEANKSKVTVVRRDSREKQTIPISQLTKIITNVEEQILKHLKRNANKYLKNSIHDAKTLEEINDVVNKKRGFARINFCSIESDGENCADRIQKYTKGGVVRGILLDNKLNPSEKPTGKCICGQKAKSVVYVAKQF
tara:strand:+ start:51 stop:1511 length:1461 start_codon:yes stop_codon:yes gene_type:complete